MALLDRLLAQRGLQRADLMLSSRKPFSKLLRRDGVPESEELSRVLALPRKDETPPDLVELLTKYLAKSDRVRLWEHQALMLLYAHDLNGAFGSLPVGQGKTLITLLVATLLKAERPVLMIPKQLQGKTIRDYKKLKKDWHVTLPTILGYELLSHPAHENDLELLNPDVLILDEGERAGRNTAVPSTLHRRVDRFKAGHPECTVLVMSANLEGSELIRYQAILKWCLGPEKMPLPKTVHETRLWGQAIDHDVPIGTRLAFGALRAFGEDPRQGLGDHIERTPGVVRVLESSCKAPLHIRKWKPLLPPVVKQALDYILQENKRPDGEELEEWEVYGVLMQVVLGFYYVPDPIPPKEWVTARRAYNRAVRHVLEEEIPGLDSPAQVRDAMQFERIPGIGILERWQLIDRECNIGKRTVWLSKDVIGQALREAKKEKGCVIWSRLRAVGEALEEMGVPHYSQGGFDRRGNHIEDASGYISASIKACSVGMNLQQWSRAMVLTPMSSSDPWEQLIGRFHRANQDADKVVIKVINAITQHQTALSKALYEAKHITKMSRSAKKLVIAKFG